MRRTDHGVKGRHACRSQAMKGVSQIRGGAWTTVSLGIEPSEWVRERPSRSLFLIIGSPDNPPSAEALFVCKLERGRRKSKVWQSCRLSSSQESARMCCCIFSLYYSVRANTFTRLFVVREGYGVRAYILSSHKDRGKRTNDSRRCCGLLRSAHVQLSLQ
ncbi:hypothetical protein Naga_100002g95 [Nannochloropsis gaditana]|uniref:Uncharacterized protein n=1 Tax=Nannochloropsis gaditana TaxID=72520 RepID=W7TR90_9STRA|nr:hypothetical protein Naga_100002g95 [Nannochloropsis gaditana]